MERNMVTAIIIAALCGTLAGGVGTGVVLVKKHKAEAAEQQALANIEAERTEAIKSIADAGVRQAEAVVPLVESVQRLETMRADLRADLAGAAGLPTGCLDLDESLTPVCITVKCWQFQQSDAGRSSQDECTAWSKLARAQAEK